MKSEKNSGRWVVLFITAISTFMSALDGSIVNVALPKMAWELHVATGQATWIVSIYLLVLSVCTLLFGRLGDLRGQGRIFRFGLLTFTGGSLLCGLSGTFPLLIGSRAVQAVGAAACMANCQGIITRTFPQEERGRALGINGAFVALGMLAGPALGGAILSFADWKVLFWINVPVGTAAILANLHFTGAKDVRRREKLDWTGFFLFTLIICPLFLALQYGQAVGYGNPLILTCFGVAAVSAVLFLTAEKRSPQPLLDLSIFRNKWFSISLFCAFTSFVAIAGSNIVLPFYLQDVLGMTPGKAGAYLTIYPLILALTAPLSGWLSDRVGAERITALGLALTSAGLYLLSGLNGSPSRVELGGFISVMSLGNGLFQSPNNSLVMSMLPPEKLGTGGSMNALVRNVGMAAGTALSTAILYGGMSARLGRRVSGFEPGGEEAFLFGMRAVYITAATICLTGAVLTTVRLLSLRKRKASKK